MRRSKTFNKKNSDTQPKYGKNELNQILHYFSNIFPNLKKGSSPLS